MGLIKVVLCNIYAPNKENPDFFHEVNVILGNMEGQIILAGHFNQVMDMTNRSQFTGNSTPKKRLATHMAADCGPYRHMEIRPS